MREDKRQDMTDNGKQRMGNIPKSSSWTVGHNSLTSLKVSGSNEEEDTLHSQRSPQVVPHLQQREIVIGLHTAAVHLLWLYHQC